MITAEQLRTSEAKRTASTAVLYAFAHDMHEHGSVLETTKSKYLDEELTLVAEILAQREKGGAIPRIYEKRGDDFFDEHNVSISSVLDDGIEAINEDVARDKDGAYLESVRRAAERQNLRIQTRMKPGEYMLEASMTDYTWTKGQQKHWGYSGDTLIRLTCMGAADKVYQFTLVLPVSSKRMHRALAHYMDSSAQTATDLLADPQIAWFDGGVDLLASRIQSDLDRILLAQHPGLALARMVKKARKKTDPWSAVRARNDLHELFVNKVEDIAATKPEETWDEEINRTRLGFVKLFVESSEKPGVRADSIDGAAERAAEAGDSYTGCNGTIEATPPQTRSDQVKSLMDNVVGYGQCPCGARGALHGCGLCANCNREWCRAYEKNGKMTEISELSAVKKTKAQKEKTYRAYARTTDSTSPLESSPKPSLLSRIFNFLVE